MLNSPLKKSLLILFFVKVAILLTNYRLDLGLEDSFHSILPTPLYKCQFYPTKKLAMSKLLLTSSIKYKNGAGLVINLFASLQQTCKNRCHY